MPRPIYLDNAATTQPCQRALDAMHGVQQQQFGNPSSQHQFGPPAKKVLDDAREFLRGTLSAAQVVFTSGGSEADCLGIVGAAMARGPGRVLMSQADHPAILNTARLLARLRCHTSELPVSQDGDVEPETLFEALGADVKVVALMHGHNELGTLSRLEEQIALVRRTAPEAHVHVDLVQAYGKIPFDLDAMDVDSVAVSAHKFHGPRGAGFLALSSKARVEPLLPAGGQEGGMRGGTENVAGAVGMMVAAEESLLRQRQHAERMGAICAQIEEAVCRALPSAERLGHPDRRLPHVLSLLLPGIVGETLMLRCAARGLAFSTGSACHGKDQGAGKDAHKPKNHVLAAIGMDQRLARCVIRLSPSKDTTLQEAEAAAAILVEEALALREAAPGAGARR